MNIEKLICTEIELDDKKYKVVGVKFEEDNIILNVEEIKEAMYKWTDLRKYLTIC